MGLQMPHSGYFKLLPVVVFVGGCTFGEGPEFVLPDSDQTASESEMTAVNDVIPNMGDAQEANNSVQMLEVESTSSTVAQEDQAAQPEVEPESISTNISTTESENASGESIAPIVSSDPANSAEASIAPAVAPDNDAIIRIPRTDRSNAPVIDGETIDYIGGTELIGGEWQFAAQFDAALQPLAISQFMFGNSDQTSTSAYHHWAVIHDGEYLYLIVVIDDDGEHFQDSNEQRKLWKDDSVELFFDGNNSQLTDYDGVDDFHITVNLQSSPGVANASYGTDPKITGSDQSAAVPGDFVFKAGLNKGPQPSDATRARTDIYEFRIKLSELNIQLDVPFGIEVQFNDDDDGDTRDAKWGWRHPVGNDSSNDFTWQNPSFMGTAVLIR